MNPSTAQAATEEQATKCFADLKKYESDFKNAVTDFLISNDLTCLLIETRDSKLGAIRIMQILKQLKKGKRNKKVLKRYWSAKNQTFLYWKQLLDIAGTTETLPKFANLLVSTFPDDEPIKIDKIEKEVLVKIRKRSSIYDVKKDIFITSQKERFNQYLKDVDPSGILKIDEFRNRVSWIWHEAVTFIDNASCGDINGVTELLKNGVDVNGIALRDKSTPLHKAAENGHTEVVLTLLRNGADILPSFRGDTPLHLAALNGHIDVVLVLLENGVDVDIRNDEGDTALMCASTQDHIDMVKTLLGHGANVNAESHSGLTPLHMAASNSKELVRTLVNCGADVNAKDKSNHTTLHCATLHRHTENVKILLEKGADVHAQNKNGETALDMAVKWGLNGVVSLLRPIT